MLSNFMSTCKVGKNCRVKAFGWVQVGGGGEGFPKEECLVGDLLKIMGGPSYMGLTCWEARTLVGLLHFVGPYPQV
jgi:hypothetical protein